jgi:hypothetical protein
VSGVWCVELQGEGGVDAERRQPTTTETKLKNAACNDTITLSAARSAIKNNWTTALQVTGIG